MRYLGKYNEQYGIKGTYMYALTPRVHQINHLNTEIRIPEFFSSNQYLVIQ